MSKKIMATAGIPYRLKYSVSLDGINEYITYGDIADFERTTTFSVSAWFKTSSASGSIYSRRGPSTAFKGWELSNTAGKIRLNLTSNNVTANRLEVRTDAATFADGAWHHVIATYAGTSLASGVILYLDGALEASTASSDALSANISNAFDCNMGARNNGDNPWDGFLTECSLYDKVLSLAEVQKIYHGGKPRDLTTLSTEPNLITWPRFTDVEIANFPTIADYSGAGLSGTATNMEVGDIQGDIPA